MAKEQPIKVVQKPPTKHYYYVGLKLKVKWERD